MTTQYTTEALTIQMQNTMAWYDANAYSEAFNYSDAERKEMLDEIEAIANELDARAA